ncbi:MAG: phosphoribosyltransferase [Candidatus Kariarchaeaceae archaeon]|jgi:predicted phosphoribosyltransferase
MIIENPELRNKVGVFIDRLDAGTQLTTYLDETEIDLVLSIPNGGVPILESIFKKLNIPEFNLLIIRKIPLHSTKESGFGAITLDGKIILNDNLVTQLNYTDNILNKQIAIAKNELQIKMEQYELDPINATGKSILITDDGIASGYSMRAGINWIRHQGAEKVIIAIPTAPLRSLQPILPLVEKLICLNVREGPYFAVADAYQHWYDVSTDEAKQILDRINHA